MRLADRSLTKFSEALACITSRTHVPCVGTERFEAHPADLAGAVTAALLKRVIIEARRGGAAARERQAAGRRSGGPWDSEGVVGAAERTAADRGHVGWLASVGCLDADAAR